MSTVRAVRHECDRCGIYVRAAIAAINGDLQLTLCGHHAARNKDALEAQGFTLFPLDAKVPA